MKSNSDSEQLSAPETSFIFLAVRVIALGQASFLICFCFIFCLTAFALFFFYVVCEAVFIFHLNLKISIEFSPRFRKVFLWPLELVCGPCGEAVEGSPTAVRAKPVRKVFN